MLTSFLNLLQKANIMRIFGDTVGNAAGYLLYVWLCTFIIDRTLQLTEIKKWCSDSVISIRLNYSNRKCLKIDNW